MPFYLYKEIPPMPPTKYAPLATLRRTAAHALIACMLFAPLAQASDSSEVRSTPVKPSTDAPDTAITIYNSNFAVIRQTVPLNLQAGINDIRFTGTTTHLQPDTVILRDPEGTHKIQIVEQSYRNDPVTEQKLLSLFEGKSVDFEVRQPDGTIKVIPAKIIRSGYIPNYNYAYGQRYVQQQAAYAQSETPIVEYDGRIHFAYPGTPVFPSLGEDTILKPALNWRLRTDRSGSFNAELSYISGGMMWNADYNLVAQEKGDKVDLIGWVTFDNQSGRSFDNAQIKLMAGDVNKLEDNNGNVRREYAAKAMAMDAAMAPVTTEKSFDEFHLYTLNVPVNLRDHETKQVEFIHATNVKSERIYVYDGLDATQYYGWNEEMIRNNGEYGTKTNKKVWVMQEFKNSELNGLGIPLPKGHLRFYKRDDDGRLEFTGENQIDHTPKDETVRVYTGNAFDLVGERKRMNYKIDTNLHTIDETFEIRLRNHKKTEAEFRVVEHMYRYANWNITVSNYKSTKPDARTAEYRVTVPADGERVINYTVHYSW